MFEQLDISTPSHTCFIDITTQVQRVVSQTGIKQGICHIFVPHTTAGLTINENADPTVSSDILAQLDRIVPWRSGYTHAEGNSAAHIKASLLGSSHAILVVSGQLKLGIWQGIYLGEFDGPRRRKVWVKVVAG